MSSAAWHTTSHDSTTKSKAVNIDNAKQAQEIQPPTPLPTRSLGSGTALAIGAFGTTLTALSLALMGWRGVSIDNVFIGDFFFVAAFGLVITAQWEMSLGNGFAYTVFSAFGLFYAGFGAIITPAFGVKAAFGDDTVMYNNAVGFFMILWTIFVLTFLVASIPTNWVYIGIFLFVELGFLTVAASYFAQADGHSASSLALQKAGGVFCFLAGLLGWYLTFHLLLKDVLVDLPLGDTSKYFNKRKRTEPGVRAGAEA